MSVSELLVISNGDAQYSIYGSRKSQPLSHLSDAPPGPIVTGTTQSLVFTAMSRSPHGGSVCCV
ncbi:hypothetical protein E2C01_000352 [Portunus trituberculatus]|uniref:Uncharacterized protein n=1 Tax=Portunus trituberculatus TaxID=210409 RepID=A0A5B7CEQ5_PORTR|nr:hypothetical protein [Portunus trituberculatus]